MVLYRLAIYRYLYIYIVTLPEISHIKNLFFFVAQIKAHVNIKAKQQVRSTQKKRRVQLEISSMSDSDQLHSSRAQLCNRKNIVSHGIAFGGCAWGCLFYLPFLSRLRVLLQRAGQSDIPVSGSSSGALTAILFALGVSDEEALRAYTSLRDVGKVHGYIGNMSFYHSMFLHKYLPAGGSEFQRLSGRLYISYTAFPCRNVVVCNWTSNLHIHEVAYASMCIPVYCNHTPQTIFGIDGGFSKSYCPIDRAQTLLRLSPINKADIAPDKPFPLSWCLWPIDRVDAVIERSTQLSRRLNWDDRRELLYLDTETCQDGTRGTSRRYLGTPRNVTSTRRRRGAFACIRAMLRVYMASVSWPWFVIRRFNSSRMPLLCLIISICVMILRRRTVLVHSRWRRPL